MKVSVNISAEKGINGYSWSSTLKFKSHAKKLVSIRDDHADILIALEEAVKFSLDAIKGNCNIDFFTTSIGSTAIISSFLDKSNESKKQYPHHIVKFYAS